MNKDQKSTKVKVNDFELSNSWSSLRRENRNKHWSHPEVCTTLLILFSHLYSIVSPFDNRQLPYNIVGNVHTTRRSSKIENRGKTIPKENSARISFAASSSFFWFAIQKLLWAVSCAKNSMVWKKEVITSQSLGTYN